MGSNKEEDGPSDDEEDGVGDDEQEEASGRWRTTIVGRAGRWKEEDGTGRVLMTRKTGRGK